MIDDTSLRELALFAGSGGCILGGKILGWRTVCAVEINEYCRRVLMQRQDDEILDPFPIWDDITTFDGRPWAGCVDIVTGGFPCQDISAAGKGAGINGERSGLWSEMARVIGEVRPRYVLVENSPMLTLRGLGTVLGDLAALGFDAEWGCISAAETGAPHKRERIWIVAYTNTRDAKRGQSERPEICASQSNQGPDDHFGRSTEMANHPQLGRGSRLAGRPDPGDSRESEQPLPDVANANSTGCEWQRQAQPEGWIGDAFPARASKDVANCHRHTAQRLESESQSRQHRRPSGLHSRTCCFTAWPADPADAPESGLGRVAHGVGHRVDRLKAIGNGQVPRVVAAAWSLLRRFSEE